MNPFLKPDEREAQLEARVDQLAASLDAAHFEIARLRSSLADIAARLAEPAFEGEPATLPSELAEAMARVALQSQNC